MHEDQNVPLWASDLGLHYLLTVHSHMVSVIQKIGHNAPVLYNHGPPTLRQREMSHIVTVVLSLQYRAKIAVDEKHDKPRVKQQWFYSGEMLDEM